MPLKPDGISVFIENALETLKNRIKYTNSMIYLLLI